MSKKLKILVAGGGGREDALCWKIAASPLVSAVICAPGNAGIAKRARCFPVSASDVEGLVSLAVSQTVDLAVIGPEVPLSLGLADRLEAEKIRVFGPSKAAARLETSKVFSKRFMARHSIPTADFEVFDDAESAADFLKRAAFPVVIKADGLAAGKGVFVCSVPADAARALRSIMKEKMFGDAGARVVIERCLPGKELSFFAVSDGANLLPLEAFADRKRLLDGDRGPNTGGMGAFGPAPFATPELCRRIMSEVMEPAVSGMSNEGHPYRGVLYAGLMIDGDDIKTLEFNCRFGDPETQPMMLRMDSDIVPLLLVCAEGNLKNFGAVRWHPRSALCVTMASRGYPGGYEKGVPLRGIPDDDSDDTVVFHCATAEENGALVSSGGRVLSVAALGETMDDAARRAYRVVRQIDEKTGEGVLCFRKDIWRKRS